MKRACGKLQTNFNFWDVCMWICVVCVRTQIVCLNMCWSVILELAACSRKIQNRRPALSEMLRSFLRTEVALMKEFLLGKCYCVSMCSGASWPPAILSLFSFCNMYGLGTQRKIKHCLLSTSRWLCSILLTYYSFFKTNSADFFTILIVGACRHTHVQIDIDAHYGLQVAVLPTILLQDYI